MTRRGWLARALRFVPAMKALMRPSGATRWVILGLLCWTVSATPIRVIDGDTVIADLAIWPGLTARETIRVLGVDTPEPKGITRPAGEAARLFARDWLQRGPVEVRVCERDAFGRALGQVTRDGEDLAKALIQAGHGIPYRQ